MWFPWASSSDLNLLWNMCMPSAAPPKTHGCTPCRSVLAFHLLKRPSSYHKVRDCILVLDSQLSANDVLLCDMLFCSLSRCDARLQAAHTHMVACMHAGESTIEAGAALYAPCHHSSISLAITPHCH
jgi:hypothetical protein